MKALFIPLALFALASGPALAQSHDAKRHSHMPMAQHAPASMAEGEVRKIDKDSGRITLKHGPIANLDMPPMTMAFKAKDGALLDKVKVGDRVRFAAEQSAGALTVTAIEPAK